jgi:Outer membrane protein beta-barrel domain
MEQFNSRDDFEQFLRNCTDDFIMIPARKVWYGIYNDMHPAKRWPSLAIALVMLFSILFVGISNNNALNNASLHKELVFATKSVSSEKNSVIAEKQPEKNIARIVKATINNEKINNTTVIDNINKNEVLNNDDVNSIGNIPTSFTTYNTNKKTSVDNKKSNKSTQRQSKKYFNTSVLNEVTDEEIALQDPSNSKKLKPLIINNATIDLQNNGTALNDNNNSISTKELKIDDKQALEKSIKNEEKEWMEDYALKNKPKLYFSKPSKTITYYLTPSYGFRNLSKVSLNKSAATSSTMARSTFMDDKESNNDKAAINIEAGTSLRFPINKRVFLKVGAQFNYTNYITKATDIGHTTEAIVATNPNLNYVKATTYTTEKGKANLNNTTLQISIPVGLDVKLVNAGKINWYLGATLQPTYTFGGSAFLLSTDERNYISDHTMLRKWNINTAIETFITYKPSAQVTVEFGPQLRYQLFSTYKQIYSYKENLYNIGMKIGVTRSF